MTVDYFLCHIISGTSTRNQHYAPIVSANHVFIDIPNLRLKPYRDARRKRMEVLRAKRSRLYNRQFLKVLLQLLIVIVLLSLFVVCFNR